MIQYEVKKGKEKYTSRTKRESRKGIMMSISFGFLLKKQNLFSKKQLEFFSPQNLLLYAVLQILPTLVLTELNVFPTENHQNWNSK